jgi:hypothetical protein
VVQLSPAERLGIAVACLGKGGSSQSGTTSSNPPSSSGESDANLTSKLVRFAFVNDNAVDLTVIDRKSPDLPDD